MKKVLYIGNKLQNKSSNLSSIHTLGPLLENEGFTVYYASSKSNKIQRFADMVFTFFRRAHCIDVVLIDTYSTHNFYYALVISQLCRLFKIEYIPSLNGGNLPERLRQHPKMSRMIFKHAKFNISPSKYLMNSFKKFGYTNIQHIPNNLNLENYKVIEKDFSCPKLLWVRSFSQIYNPKMAIRVLRQLKETHPNAELCMVGPDGDGCLKDVKNLALKLNVDVKITGKLTKIEWITLAEHYNVFINTTNFDNTPVSVIEAMALGLPVVSTNVGGMPFLIDNNFDGILVDPNNVDKMVKAIRHILIDESKRNEIIRNARLKVEQFDWQKIKKKWVSIL